MPKHRTPGPSTCGRLYHILHALVNRQNAQKNPAPYLRGQDSVTLYFFPAHTNKNSRSGFTISTKLHIGCSFNTSVKSSIKPSFTESLAFSLLVGVLRGLLSAFVAALAAFFCSAVSSKSFSPLSIALSSSMRAIASSRLRSRFFISLEIVSSILITS